MELVYVMLIVWSKGILSGVWAKVVANLGNMYLGEAWYTHNRAMQTMLGDVGF